jgi:uncharacterized repeat protein (TIGR03833 family)
MKVLIFTDKSPDLRMNGTRRDAIYAGCTVDIILKQDQRSGKVTRGIVRDILTNSPTHPHGIKVRLKDGHVGRVVRIIGSDLPGTAH